MQRIERLVTMFLFGFILIGFTPQTASAHALYQRSTPAKDAVIAHAPAQVDIWFEEELFRHAGDNVIEVYGPRNKRVDNNDTALDDDDRTHLTVTLQNDLPDGVYTVRWRNVSADDNHAANGEFTFTVNPAAASQQPVSPISATVAETSSQAIPAPATLSAEVTTSAGIIASPAISPTPAPAANVASPSHASGGLPCLGGSAVGILAVGLVWIEKRRRA